MNQGVCVAALVKERISCWCCGCIKDFRQNYENYIYIDLFVSLTQVFFIIGHGV